MASAISNLSALRTAPSTGNSSERFNKEAASWDSRPFVHDASSAAAKAILLRLESGGLAVNEIDNLEIGCGTGILSFLLAAHFYRIVTVDAAEGMIAVLQNKLRAPGAPRNITPVAVLLDDPEDDALPASEGDGSGKRIKFDLITSHLVLHHIPELEPVLRTMHGCLKPGGRVMLTDFHDFGPEARRFHPESKLDGVARHGIDIDVMTKIMTSAGFANVDVSVAWTMPKMVDGKIGNEEESMQFPFVMCCDLFCWAHLMVSPDNDINEFRLACDAVPTCKIYVS